MKSMIRAILEAEDITLNPEPTSAADVSGEPMSGGDFAPPPPPPAPGQAPAAQLPTPPTMPTVPLGNNTIQKEVLNKQLILAITAELKGTISTYEKKFESEDFTMEDAKIYISSFLESLAFHAQKLEHLLGGGEEETPEEMPMEEPMPEEPTPEPEAAPETAGLEPTPEPLPEEGGEAPGAGGEGEYNPYGPGPTPSEFTNPSEAI